MKYKVGDKVRVRDDLEFGRKYDNITLYDSMGAYLGKIGIIKAISAYDNYFLDNDYYWAEEMLEPVFTDKEIAKENK